jgi:gluconate 2-dehydrogenase gamma chain
MDRRTFLARASGLGIAITAPWALRLAEASIADMDGAGLKKLQWQTLAAVQEHLFPGESHTPGAADVNAAAYLHFVLSDPEIDPAEAKLIHNGLTQLEALVRQRHGKGFIALSEAEREASLRQFEKTTTGRHWITDILGYIFEALLTDPVYGGNPGGIGWKWLDHPPGFPRPTAGKRYFLL